MAAHTALGISARGRPARRGGGRAARAALARTRALGGLPQRRHAGAQQRLRSGRRRHRLPAESAASAAPPGRLRPAAHGCRAGWRRSRCRRAYRAAYAVCFVLSILYSVPAVPAQGRRRRGLADQHGGLRHADAARRMGRDRAAARDHASHRAARVLSALRRTLSAHPALSARGGRPARRPDAGADARRASEASTSR